LNLVATKPDEASQYLMLAEKDLQNATTINPAQGSAFATLSSLYYRKQSLSDAVLAAQSAYRADAYLASMAFILQRLFWTLHDTEAFADAETWCNEGRRRFPANPFFVECGLWLLSTKYKEPYDPDAAWRLYESLKKATPSARLALDTLRGRIIVGMVLARAADAAKTDDPARAKALADSAARVLSRARPSTDIDPKHELYGFEAAARVALHDYDGAVALLKTYVQSNPEHIRGFKTNTAWWWRDPKLQDHPGFKAMLASTR
jgi:tetratricopeptide (TPR) repeat protein